MDNNIINEIKQVDIAIGKKIFEMNNNNILTKHPSPLQMGIIEILINNNGITDQNTLTKELHISKAAISSGLQSMEKKGLIERIPSSKDARKNNIILSQQGMNTFKEIQFINIISF